MDRHRHRTYLGITEADYISNPRSLMPRGSLKPHQYPKRCSPVREGDTIFRQTTPLSNGNTEHTILMSSSDCQMNSSPCCLSKHFTQRYITPDHITLYHSSLLRWASIRYSLPSMHEPASHCASLHGTHISYAAIMRSTRYCRTRYKTQSRAATFMHADTTKCGSKPYLHGNLTLEQEAHYRRQQR
jgi:hypothetical protein